MCGGGRYNSLVENLGGPAMSGVGFALGLERLLNALDAENITLPYNNSLDIYVIPMSENEKEFSFNLVQSLRMSGFTADIDYMNRKIGSNFKQADRFNTKFIVIVGEEEINSGMLTIKNNKTKEEYHVPNSELITFFDENVEEDEQHEH